MAGGFGILFARSVPPPCRPGPLHLRHPLSPGRDSHGHGDPRPARHERGDQALDGGKLHCREGIPLSGSYKEGIVAVFRNMGLFIRSCLIAWVVGVAPGAGSSVSGFVAYAPRQRHARTRDLRKGTYGASLQGYRTPCLCGRGSPSHHHPGIPAATPWLSSSEPLSCTGSRPGPRSLKCALT